MNRRLTERLIAGLLLVFLLSYVGFQAYRYANESISTETVFEYSVSRSLPVQGIAVRDEILIEGAFAGVENTLFEDGTRVSIGENVAEFYASDAADKQYKRARELEAEIAMLIKAQDKAVNNLSATDMLNRNIRDQIGRLAQLSNEGRFDEFLEIRPLLNDYINKKQIATGQANDFESRITALRSELSTLDAAAGQDTITVAAAPITGYFSSVVDGYEGKLSPDILKGYDLQQYIGLVTENENTAFSGGIGKIVRDQHWLFICTAPKESLEFVLPGMTVNLKFSEINKQVKANVAEILQEKDDDSAILRLSCDEVTGELINLRRAEAVIHFDQFSGLRINMADVRFVDDKRGVYVLDNNIVRFKLIDAVYEEQNFVLSQVRPPETDDTEYVALFDQIITKGNDLYDGKVIQ